jgi:hypothetical protein
MPEKTLSEQLLPWAPYLGTIGGALVAGLIALGITFINKKSEERRHLRELMFNAAVENWKHNNIAAIELMKAGNRVELMPLDSYIVNLLALSGSLLDTTLTKDNIKAKLKEAYEISEEADKFINDSNVNAK